MAELNQESIVPLYKQLKDKIRDDIRAGVLRPNQQIPTEKELSEFYGISRMTVRNAISELVDEGILAKKQGKGTFVLEPKIEEDLVNSSSFTALCRRNGKVPGSRTIRSVLKEPTERDIAELELETGERVIHIERLRTADGVPVMLENLYFPGRLGALLTEDLDDRSLYQIAWEHYGLTADDCSWEIEISEASTYEAALLEVKVNTPLLLIRQIAYDENGLPFHRTKSVLVGNKIRYCMPRSKPPRERKEK